MTDEAVFALNFVKGAHVVAYPFSKGFDKLYTKHVHLQQGSLSEWEPVDVRLFRVGNSNYFVGACTCGCRFFYDQCKAPG